MKHDLTTEAGQLASLLDFYKVDRQRAQEAHLWYEVRYWYARPAGYMGTPSNWCPIVYAGSRSSAGIVAESLHRDRGWWCEVWSCSPVIDPDIPQVSSGPVRWHLCDVVPNRGYPDLPNRPSSGNLGEKPSRWD